MKPQLRITGEVARPSEFDFQALAALPATWQVDDVSQFDPRRAGRAVRLAGLLEAAKPQETARYLTLHASKDDFHASIPLDSVRERGLLIYGRADGIPLPVEQGGPFRFLIPDYAACRSSEIDECANVKFVEHLELSRSRGYDNRPHDEAEHAELHARQESRIE